MRRTSSSPDTGSVRLARLGTVRADLLSKGSRLTAVSCDRSPASTQLDSARTANALDRRKNSCTQKTIAKMYTSCMVQYNLRALPTGSRVLQGKLPAFQQCVQNRDSVHFCFSLTCPQYEQHCCALQTLQEGELLVKHWLATLKKGPIRARRIAVVDKVNHETKFTL